MLYNSTGFAKIGVPDSRNIHFILINNGTNAFALLELKFFK